MEIFVRSSHLPVSCEEAFAWHERPGALERMLPPWDSFKILDQQGTLSNGGTFKVRAKIGFLKTSFLLQHQNYVRNVQYEDVQLKGLFSSWKHRYQFEKMDEKKSKLTTHIEYALPVGFLSHLVNETVLEQKLDKLFAYRHRTLINDLFLHSLYSKKKLTILVTGSTGFVASALIPFLTAGGHKVLKLQRKAENSASTDHITWDPATSTFQNSERLEHVDAVVHLAGANIAEKKWSAKRKKVLIESRVSFTKALCKALVTLKNPPKTLITASGMGIFGNRDRDDILTEDSKMGEGFLADLAHDWELACEEARKSGMRVVNLRFGAILSPAGGMLKKLITPFQFFLGGPIGSGKQFMPWISLTDVLGLILFSLASEVVTGPVNALSPGIVTNEQFCNTLAQVLDKPNAFRVPECAIKLLLGEMGETLLLYSQNARPEKSLKYGYEFLHRDLEDTLRYYL